MKEKFTVGAICYVEGRWESCVKIPPEEVQVALYVNDRLLVSLLCTSKMLEELIVGFLYSADLIKTCDDIVDMQCGEYEVRVKLRDDIQVNPKFKILTSGLGGVVFENKNTIYPIKTEKIHLGGLFELIDNAREMAVEYQKTGGMHFSALCNENEIVAFAEDLGRHNTVDKIVGICLLKNIVLKNKFLLTSGRISSEMIRKAAKLGISAVASFSTPTALAVQEAERVGVCIIGYVRDEYMIVYTNIKCVAL